MQPAQKHDVEHVSLLDKSINQTDAVLKKALDLLQDCAAVLEGCVAESLRRRESARAAEEAALAAGVRAEGEEEEEVENGDDNAGLAALGLHVHTVPPAAEGVHPAVGDGADAELDED